MPRLYSNAGGVPVPNDPARLLETFGDHHLRQRHGNNRAGPGVVPARRALVYRRTPSLLIYRTFTCVPGRAQRPDPRARDRRGAELLRAAEADGIAFSPRHGGEKGRGSLAAPSRPPWAEADVGEIFATLEKTRGQYFGQIPEVSGACHGEAGSLTR